MKIKLLLMTLVSLLLFSVIFNSNAADVVVPSNLDDDAQESWSPPIDSILNAGDTVRFVNNRGKAVNVPWIGFLGIDDGTLVYKTTKSVNWDTVSFVYGGYHQHFINKISPSSTGGKIRVKYLYKAK
ncbi:MAG: hypothetical protein JW915_23685 [Chitinispirillaceae bacterium]|nr:hypothetical protein [Chitinispirillaceae bacterium]